MAKDVLNEGKARFRAIMEYLEPSSMSSLNEADPNEEMPQGPQPDAMGEGPDAMSGEGMPQDPSMGGDPNAMGGDPNAMQGGEEAPQGFAPQGPDATLGGEGPEAEGGDPNSDEDGEEEVIDVDELTDAQEETKSAVDKILAKFDKIDDKMFSALDKVADMITKSNERIDSLEKKMDSRLPDDEQKMTLRAKKSTPFTQSVEGYWQTEAPKNYSPDDDEDGEGMSEYKITKNDIDDAIDYASIYKSLDDEDEKYGNMTLKDIYNL